MLTIRESLLSLLHKEIQQIEDVHAKMALTYIEQILDANKQKPTGLISRLWNLGSTQPEIPPPLPCNPSISEAVASLQEWSGHKSMHILFDSDTDGLSEDSTSFVDSVINKSRLYVIIRDTESNVFGGYIRQHISVPNTDMNDKKAFIFSLYRNGATNIRKYQILSDDIDHAYCLYKGDRSILFSFGSGVDIQLGHSSGVCEQYSFNYGDNNEHALCGSFTFTPARVLVIKMSN